MKGQVKDNIPLRIQRRTTTTSTDFVSRQGWHGDNRTDTRKAQCIDVPAWPVPKTHLAIDSLREDYNWNKKKKYPKGKHRHHLHPFRKRKHHEDAN